jgi:putative endonuclease
MPFYVYIIKCEGGTFYTGYSRNLNARMRLHAKGKGARYTRIHKPDKLVYIEEMSSRSEAMKREKQIKTLSHRQKLRLVKAKMAPNGRGAAKAFFRKRRRSRL